MAGQLDLVKAFVDQFRLDTGAGSLVALTTHDGSDPSKFRIARDQPDIKGDVPFIGVFVATSMPMVGADVTFLQRGVVAVKAYSLDELVVNKILDRLETLLHAVASPANTGSYVIPSTVVKVYAARFQERTSKVSQDEDTKVWSGAVMINVIWSFVPIN